MYYREFGIPARIARCYEVKDLENQIKKYNGKKNCYTSVYVFDDMKEKDSKKTNYESAMLNTIWFDFDDKDNVELCLKDVRKFIKKFCEPLDIIPRIYLTGGKGFQMNIDFDTHHPTHRLTFYLVFQFTGTGKISIYRDASEFQFTCTISVR